MGYNENLLNKAIVGDKNAFKELQSNAGSGDAEAQYYLAQYYVSRKNGESDYQYWLKKAVENGYVATNNDLAALNLIEKEESVSSMTNGSKSSEKMIKGLLWISGGVLLTIATNGGYIFYGAVLYGIYIILNRDY